MPDPAGRNSRLFLSLRSFQINNARLPYPARTLVVAASTRPCSLSPEAALRSARLPLAPPASPHTTQPSHCGRASEGAAYDSPDSSPLLIHPLTTSLHHRHRTTQWLSCAVFPTTSGPMSRPRSRPMRSCLPRRPCPGSRSLVDPPTMLA